MKQKIACALIIGFLSVFPFIAQAAFVLNEPPALLDAILITDAYGNPEAVEVKGKFLDDCTQIKGHQVTQMDNTLLVQVFVETISPYCAPADIAFTHVVQIDSLREGSTITVGLYNGTAMQQGVVEIYGDLMVLEGIQNDTGNAALENILVDVTPATLNLNSKGRFISAAIQLPSEYDSENMVLETVSIAGNIQAEKINRDKDGVFIAKFSRSELISHLKALNVETSTHVELHLEFKFSGTTTDLAVNAKDTIRVLN